MTRFTALASESSDEEIATEEKSIRPLPNTTKGPSRLAITHNEDDEDMTSESEFSSMDEDELEDSPPRRRNRGEDARISTSDRGHRHRLEVESDGESSSSGSQRASPVVRRHSESVIPWAHQIGIEPEKIHVMQASLFGVPEEMEALQQLETERASTRPLGFALHQSAAAKEIHDRKPVALLEV
jgi:nuclear pore complex protein Nup98-Nup96